MGHVKERMINIMLVIGSLTVTIALLVGAEFVLRLFKPEYLRDLSVDDLNVDHV